MNTKQLLSLFNLREVEIKVFESLFYNGSMNASRLAKLVNISRTSVYDLLDKLIESGLVNESQKEGTKIFSIESPEKINLLFEEKEKEIRNAKNIFQSFKDEYQNKHKSLKPQLQIFEGRKELQQMMKDMLLYRDISVYAYWPPKKMVELLSSEFFQKFHKERIERNIKLKTIWPKNQIPNFKKYPFLKIKPGNKREVRIAPPDIGFSLGYAIYRNTVRFISSSKENFGFLVQSSELAQTMNSQFKLIWNQSKSILERKK